MNTGSEGLLPDNHLNSKNTCGLWMKAAADLPDPGKVISDIN